MVINTLQYDARYTQRQKQLSQYYKIVTKMSVVLFVSFIFCCLINDTLSVIKHAQCRIRVMTERIWNVVDVIGHNLREPLIQNSPVQEEETDDNPRSLYKAFGSNL